MMRLCRVLIALILLHLRWSQQECFFGTDIALLMDISHTAGQVDSYEVRQFGQRVLSLISAHDRSLVSLITHRKEPLIRFTFDDWVVDKARPMFLDVFQIITSSSNQTHHAFRLLRNEVFTVANGARDGITDVALLVTDRPASDIAEAERRAAYLKTRGTIIFVVAIGSSILDSEIQRYVTKSTNFIRVTGFGDLELGFNDLSNAVFDCKPCPEGWIKPQVDDGFCYKLVNNRMPWQTAKTNCERIVNGSRLMVFDNQSQMMWFTAEYNDRGGTGIWVGLSRNSTTGPFTYVDGSALDPTFANWEVSYPKTELCAHYSKNGLADDSCTSQKQSVCQLDQADAVITETGGVLIP